MTKYTGALLAVTFDNNPVPAGYLKSVDTDETGGTTEGTGIGDANAVHFGTTNKTTVTLEMWDDEDDAVVWDFFVPGTTGILLIYKQGIGAPKPVDTGATAIVTGRGQGAAYNGVMPITVTLDVSGGLVPSNQA